MHYSGVSKRRDAVVGGVLLVWRSDGLTVDGGRRWSRGGPAEWRRRRRRRSSARRRQERILMCTTVSVTMATPAVRADGRDGRGGTIHRLGGWVASVTAGVGGRVACLMGASRVMVVTTVVDGSTAVAVVGVGGGGGKL